MSTRSVIGRLTASGFSGVYHHWDGYPEGLGATLYELRNGHFEGETEQMLRFLIDDHPQGWSTINGADFSLPAGPRPDHNVFLCRDCYRPIWAHYKQYYTSNNQEWIKAGRPPIPGNPLEDVYKLFSCSGQPLDCEHGPECFSKEQAMDLLTERDAQESGCEWAYAFNKDGNKMHVFSSFCQNGDKMIGMFGMGDSQSKWECVAIVDLDAKEPDWKKIGESQSVTLS